MSSDDQKQRLLKIIKDRYEGIGGHIKNDVLYAGDQVTPLAPLLNIFARIKNSKAFTRLPPLFDATENFPISDMYVELAVSESLEIADPLRLSRGLSLAAEQEARHKQSRARHINLEQCVNNLQHHKIIILGDPGSGKTSLLKYLCLQVAKGENKRWLFPVFISLRQFWLEKEKTPSLSLLHYAAASLHSQKDAGNVSANFSLLLRDKDQVYKTQGNNIKELEGILSCISSTDHQHVLFLLDGLDEIASNSEAIESVSGEIRKLGLEFSWVLTSRYTGFYSNLDEDVRYEIISLHNEAIEELVTNWFKYTRQPHALEKTKLILKQIKNNPRLMDMARNPFLLTLLCYVQDYNDQKFLPLQRNDIYTEIINLIRRQLRSKKGNNTLFAKAEFIYLARFCHYLYTEVENAPLQLFEQAHWDDCASPGTPPDLEKHFRSSRLLNSWKKQGDYHFVHLTFQEYFIAQHLSQFKFEQAKAHLYNPQWRVIYRFLAGVYGKRRDKKDLISLIKSLLDPVDKMGLLYVEASMLLIEAAVEDSTPILGYDLRKKLWDICCKDKSYLKKIAGDALAMLSPSYIIKRHLDIISHREKGPKLKKSIKLLGLTNLKEADELIFNLYQSSFHKYQNTIIKTLVDKNTPEIRTSVSNLYLQDKDKWFMTFCKFAKVSRHKDFLQLLKPYLTTRPKELTQYSALFKALSAIASTDLDQALLDFLEQYPPEELTDELIESFVSLDTKNVKEWLEKILATSTSDHTKTKILVHALKYGRLATHDILKLLQCNDEVTQRKYIVAIRHQVSNGILPAKEVTQLIVDITFSGSKNAGFAFTTLIEINPKDIIHGQISSKYKQKYRKFLNSSNKYIVLGAVMILAKIRDIQSYEAIFELARSSNYETGIRIESIRALANYHQGNNSLIIDTLHAIYKKETKQADRFLAPIALETLAKIDIGEIAGYLNEPANRDVFTKICTSENVLLFDDSYFDKFGTRHYWQGEDDFPRLDPLKEAVEQADELRAVCHYLLDHNHAKKTGRLNKKPMPLFNKNSYTHNDHINSIDANTGSRLLKGMYINADKAQVLMGWIKYKFPWVFTKQ